MKLRPIIVSLAVMALLLGFLPQEASAAVGVAACADSGVSERVPGANGKLPKDMIAWIWEAEINRTFALYALVPYCYRQDIDGFYYGSNKATFKNTRVTGLSSQNWLQVSSMKVKLRNGMPASAVARDITAAVDDVLSRDQFALGESTLKLSGQVRGGDLVSCGVSVVEVDSRYLSAKTESERQREFEELAIRTMYRKLGLPAE